MNQKREIEKIFIFGASIGGKVGLKLLRRSKNVKMLGFIDNDKNKHSSTFLGFPVLSPDRLKNRDWDKIYICSNYWLEIKNQLEQLGFISNKDFEVIPVSQQEMLKKDKLLVPFAMIVLLIVFIISILWPFKIKASS